ncbi:hypothetical protein [Legionella hackeliae]|uniref:Oleosin n=1 Tax=Legionella hackeliae TaxID=449 RepID=A0A0A8UQC6_LEGHA|nr:hypothetical protein [Legionella hackeliae]KTD13449.1 hypothetical protein Lhac_0833 [Legionella hackeliae]CEK09292.1 membrane protein of unknown function [Legionella hackeliae]STX49198.1 Uncharacterised protein [Legionella hackeliae]
MRFINFLRTHWAASLAVFLGILTAAAAVTLAVLFPAVIPALAAASFFGVTPLAFLSTLATPAAVATVGALTFAASLTASTLFNTVVSIYNFMNTLITPAQDIEPSAEIKLAKDEDEDLNGTPNLFQRVFGSCCAEKKAEPTDTVRSTFGFRSSNVSDRKQTVPLTDEVDNLQVPKCQ